MSKKYLAILGLILTISLIVNVTALDIAAQNRLDFGHVMRIQSVGTEPNEIPPGSPASLKIKVKNNADFYIKDIRVQITLPAELSFLNDISKIKLSRLEAGESQDLEFRIIALPGVSEGVYNAAITVDYVNHIGTERQDSDTMGIIVKSIPKLFVKVDSNNLYQGSKIGEATFTFVNNDIGDIKFLTVELLDSEDYEILSTTKEYIGDLDSDDFESVDFKIKLNTKNREVPLLLRLDYKDALNKDYSQELDVNFEVLTATEAGEKTTSVWSIIVWIIILGGVGYWLYKKYKKKKSKR